MSTKYNVKSILIGRKKRDEEAKKKDDTSRPCFVSLFDENNPHTKGLAPKKIIDFTAHRVIIKGANELSYLLAGNDILLNDLEEIDVAFEEHGHVIITAKQKKQ